MDYMKNFTGISAEFSSEIPLKMPSDIPFCLFFFFSEFLPEIASDILSRFVPNSFSGDSSRSYSGDP